MKKLLILNYIYKFEIKLHLKTWISIPFQKLNMNAIKIKNLKFDLNTLYVTLWKNKYIEHN